jgi:hypothetical protein
VGLVGGADSQCPWFGSLPELPHVRKRARAKHAQHSFPYCLSSIAVASGFTLQIAEIEKVLLDLANPKTKVLGAEEDNRENYFELSLLARSHTAWPESGHS